MHERLALTESATLTSTGAVPVPAGVRLEFVDALRGFAVAGVVMVHCGKRLHDLPALLSALLDFGNWGVQLFFLLSAFTLMSVYAQRELVLGSFATRRFFRIAPAFYLAAIGYLSLRGWGPRASAPTGIAWWYVVATFAFLNSWLPQVMNNVVPGGWSISVEMSFYACFPWLRRWLTSTSRAALAWVASFAIAALSARAARGVFAGHVQPTMLDDLIFFGFVWNLPAFIAGILLFHLSRGPAVWRTFTNSAKTVQFVLAISTLVLALAALGIQPLRGRAAVLVTLTTWVYSVALTSPALVVNRFTKFVGKVSFSVYLLHFAVLDLLVRPLAEMFAGASPVLLAAVVCASVLAVSVACAAVTWRWVEQTGIELGRLVSGRPRSTQVATTQSSYVGPN